MYLCESLSLPVTKLPNVYYGSKVHLLKVSTAAAAAAKSLQSCSTLSDPMVCSLPGSSIHGIFQARVLEWGAIAFSKKYLLHAFKS